MSTSSLITFAQFEQMPEAPGKQELIDGELIEMPAARLRHMIVSKRVYAQLCLGAGVDLAFIETGYRVGRGWLVPEASVAHPNQEIDDGYFSRSPVLAVEVLSPDNRASHIDRKLALYLADGAEEVWVIDPAKQTMTVCRKTPEGVIRTTVEGRHESKFGDIALATLFAI
jgi:Uma2 family endonuclease